MAQHSVSFSALLDLIKLLQRGQPADLEHILERGPVFASLLELSDHLGYTSTSDLFFKVFNYLFIFRSKII